jgi:G3E family GTPase
MVAAVRELIRTVDPDYIIIEATGAADLQAIKEICDQIKEVHLNRCIMLVNARKIKTLLKVVGEFYHMQIKQASTIYLNFTESLTDDAIRETVSFIREINAKAHIISVPLAEITKDTFPEGSETLEQPLKISATKGLLARTKHQMELQENLATWTYEVEKPLTEEELAAFWERVKSKDIWRVKGFVSMADGTTRKLDYTFGDLFETEKHLGDVSVLNKIVLIGKKDAWQ